jgi:DNA-binding transcriptional regulator YhcF (GntR family)
MFSIDEASSVPPYDQLKQAVIAALESGALQAGNKLPTVRALAAEVGLAPNTVARAYRELEALGVVDTRGRAGTFVSGAGVDRAARQAAADYLARLADLGLTRDDAIALLADR